jgi:plastocyanin
MSTKALRAIVSVLALALAGCGSKSATSPSGSSGTSSATVSMPTADYGTGSSMFSPGSVTINAGGSVTWKNDDAQDHTTTSSGWDLKVTAGNTVSRAFATKGTFLYHCTIHTNMTGTIIVQ